MKISLEKVKQQRLASEEAALAQAKLVRVIDILRQAPFPMLFIDIGGSEIIPDDRPVVVLATHQNSHDAWALCYSFYKRTGTALGLLAKNELDGIPIVSAYLKKLGAISITRSGGLANREALVETIPARLQAGSSIGSFAEGGRTYGGNIGTINPSAISVAVKAGVEIVTTGIYGPSPKSPYQPRPLSVHFGSRTDPSQIDKNDRAHFYRTQLDLDYRRALAAHYGRPQPTT